MNNLPDFIDIESAAAANNLSKTNAGIKINTNAGIQTNTNVGIQTNTNVNVQSAVMQINSIADQLKSIANSLSSNAPLPAMPANNRKNKNNALSKTKKIRTAAQLARNENMRRASASLKEKGYKATIKSIHELLKHRKEGKQNEEYFSTLGLPAIKEETTTNMAEGEGVTNTKTKLVEAGKKAATSEKGSKWLEEIKTAKKMLNSEFAKSGLKKTAKQQNAIKVASLLRKNQAAAQNYINKLLNPA